MLRRFPRKIDLHQKLGWFRLLLHRVCDPAEQRVTIQRVDPVNDADHLANLVGLQMSHEMPRDVDEGGPPFDLVESLLHPVLAEIGQARLGGGLDVGKGEGLGDPDQSNVAGFAPCPLGRPHNPLTDDHEVVRDSTFHGYGSMLASCSRASSANSPSPSNRR